MESQSKLTEGSIRPKIVALALPLLIGNIVQQFYNTVDTIIVGRYVGETAFAALGVAGTVMNLFIFILSGCCTGVAIIVAELFGRGDNKSLRREIFLSAVFGMIFTVLLSFTAIIFMPILLKAIQTPSKIMSFVERYLNIIFVGLFATFLYNLFSAVLRAIGNTKMALVFLLFSMLCNIILDMIFVAAWGLGITGAAWATVLSQILCAILCQLYVRKKLPVLKISHEDMCYDPILIRRTAQYALVSALHQSSLYIGKLLVQGAVNSIGFDAILAYTATTRIEGVAQAFGDSGAEAISVFVAQNACAGKKERYVKGFKIGFIRLTILGLVLSAIMFFGAKHLLHLFISGENENAIKNGVNYISIICCFYFLSFIGSAFVGYFRGTGRVRIPFIGTTIHITIRVILSYILVSKLSLGAVGLATGIGWVVVVTFQVIVFCKFKYYN